MKRKGSIKTAMQIAKLKNKLIAKTGSPQKKCKQTKELSYEFDEQS